MKSDYERIKEYLQLKGYSELEAAREAEKATTQIDAIRARSKRPENRSGEDAALPDGGS